MREKGAWSSATYGARAAEVKRTGGTATYVGEQNVRSGKGLDSLVAPNERGVVRLAMNLMVPEGDKFNLKFGAAMPVKTGIDTTGSMGSNVDIAFRVQPKVQNLLVQGSNAVLKRYHTQMATGVIQDVGDTFPYQVSQFEPDNEVERQMGLLAPQRGGGDAPEEYQLDIFSTAYLTRSSITEYGLRGYHFMVGDEQGRDNIERELVGRVFGGEALEKAGISKMPTTKQAANALLKKWHAFFLQVDRDSRVTSWWTEVLGKDRIVVLPRTEDLAEVQAVIIGLTEGVLNLQSAFAFLEEAKVSPTNAARIVEACSNVPRGLQRTFPNFEKIPLAGSVFASRDDIWPIGSPEAKTKPREDSGVMPQGPTERKWKL